MFTCAKLSIYIGKIKNQNQNRSSHIRSLVSFSSLPACASTCPMGRPKKLRNLIGILKDKASLLKAALLFSYNSSSIRIAVLRATTHDPSAPPSDDRVDAVLSFGLDSRTTSCACIEALMDRLHHTQNATVSLKCLIVLHNIVARGSFILKDQLSFYPSAGGRNFLNLSRFRDESDADTWELSSWVRWYAGVLEQNLMASRILGSYFGSSSRIVEKNTEEKVSALLNSVLLSELDALVGFIERLCEAPNSLQKNNLVYEIVRLVGDDYRFAQYEIFSRVTECEDRTGNLSSSELAQLLCGLKRLEDYKERLMVLFVNRKRNDAFWDLISQTRVKLVTVKEQREERRLVMKGRREESSELTRFRERVAGSGHLFRFSSDGPGLDVDRARLTISAVR
ncbi:hypothetical protein L1049_025527 [Liquidambar formosana]|uniref:ENTH domain-containing protein n=1 Tax=Liquidambar formosana TaxID=63359 RepID=A0AAP0R6F7_LIQFO